MERYKTCSFFGHREINFSNGLKQRLKDIIENLIIHHNVFRFLFGSHSKFNDLCLLVVTDLKEKYPNIKRVAYTVKSESCILEAERQKWEEIYFRFQKQKVNLLAVEEEFEHKTKYTAGKAGYVERNQAMIDDSDFCIFYYDENYQPKPRKSSKQGFNYYVPKSGTKLAYDYAKRKKKQIINVANL